MPTHDHKIIKSKTNCKRGWPLKDFSTFFEVRVFCVAFFPSVILSAFFKVSIFSVDCLPGVIYILVHGISFYSHRRKFTRSTKLQHKPHHAAALASGACK